MKYTRIIIVIIIIISLGQILLSYIENTSHAHARTPVRTHTAEPFRLALCDGSVAPNRDGPFCWRQWASLVHSNKHTRGRSGFLRFCVFFAYIKKLLGGTEKRTCDRMCFQTIRTVWDISRDDRAKIATCSLLTSPDRFKENYSIIIWMCHYNLCVSRISWM